MPEKSQSGDGSLAKSSSTITGPTYKCPGTIGQKEVPSESGYEVKDVPPPCLLMQHLYRYRTQYLDLEEYKKWFHCTHQ